MAVIDADFIFIWRLTSRLRKIRCTIAATPTNPITNTAVQKAIRKYIHESGISSVPNAKKSIGKFYSESVNITSRAAKLWLLLSHSPWHVMRLRRALPSFE